MIGEELKTRLSSQAVEFGLRCNLEQLPEPRPAKVPLTLERCEGPFEGFNAELERTTGADYGRALRRKRLHEKGVRTLRHLGRRSDSGLRPVAHYPARQASPRSTRPRLLASAEGRRGSVGVRLHVYAVPGTGSNDRRDGSAAARGSSARGQVSPDLRPVRQHPEVLSDNIPSLRGCAKVCFDLDHVKAVSRRLGVHRSEIRPSSDADLQCWQQATAPRQPT